MKANLEQKGLYSMSKKVVSILLIIAVLASLFLSACGNDEGEDDTGAWSEIPDGISLVIIVGSHANSNNLLSDPDMVRDIEGLVAKAYTYGEKGNNSFAQGNISIIVCDSKPELMQVTDDGEILDLYVEANTADYLKETAVPKQVSKIMEFLQSDAVYADDKEVDLLSAMYEAKFILDSTPGIEKHILILDSGICTAGGFNMRVNNIQDGTVDDIISRIPAEAFPDLGKDVKVTFYGLGNVAEPQTLPNFLSGQFVDVWTRLIEDENCCNASLTTPILRYKDRGLPLMWNEEGTGLPYVSVVPFKDVTVTSEIVIEDPGTTVFPTSGLGFNPNEATFIDEDQAKLLIGSVAGNYKEYLAANPTAKIYVVGSIARDAADEPVKNHSDVSAQRSNRVADILVKTYGLPADRVIPIDAGSTVFSWRNSDEFPNGVENDDNQQKNRVVAIIPDSAEAEINELKGAGYIG